MHAYDGILSTVSRTAGQVALLLCAEGSAEQAPSFGYRLLSPTVDESGGSVPDGNLAKPIYRDSVKSAIMLSYIRDSNQLSRLHRRAARDFLCPPPMFSRQNMCMHAWREVAVNMSKDCMCVFSQQTLMLKPLDATFARCEGTKQAPRHCAFNLAHEHQLMKRLSMFCQ